MSVIVLPAEPVVTTTVYEVSASHLIGGALILGAAYLGGTVLYSLSTAPWIGWAVMLAVPLVAVLALRACYNQGLTEGETPLESGLKAPLRAGLGFVTVTANIVGALAGALTYIGW
jgi:hypothetical protein